MNKRIADTAYPLPRRWEERVAAERALAVQIQLATRVTHFEALRIAQRIITTEIECHDRREI